MYTSYALEEYGRARMREHLEEAEQQRLLAAVPRSPRRWPLGRAQLRRLWPEDGGATPGEARR